MASPRLSCALPQNHLEGIAGSWVWRARRWLAATSRRLLGRHLLEVSRAAGVLLSLLLHTASWRLTPSRPILIRPAALTVAHSRFCGAHMREGIGNPLTFSPGHTPDDRRQCLFDGLLCLQGARVEEGSLLCRARPLRARTLLTSGDNLSRPVDTYRLFGGRTRRELLCGAQTAPDE